MKQPRWCVLGACLGLATACGVDEAQAISTSAGTGTTGSSTSPDQTSTANTTTAGTMTSGATTSGTSTTGDDTGGSTEGPDPSLVNRGVLVRYFLADAMTGQPPIQLADAAPNPLPMPLDYLDSPPQPVFDVDFDNRGLRWTDVDSDGVALVETDGTKLQVIDGMSVGTMEVVVRVDATGVNGARILHFGNNSESGNYTLRFIGSGAGDTLQLRVNNAIWAEWASTTIEGRGRTVVHLVVDTSQASEDRVVLYFDGVRTEPPNTTNAPSGGMIAIDTNDEMTIGNRGNGDRSFQGTIYYAAVYTTALDPSEVAANAARLLVSDDP